MGNKSAILLLSGGIDSTTLLAQAKQEGYEIQAISFNYNQKHLVELEYAKKNARKYQVAKHKIISLDAGAFLSSALVNPHKSLETYPKHRLPEGPVNAYVPFRNLIFLSHALSYAETAGIRKIFIAFNKDDSTNFWDCSSEFLQKLNALTNSSTAIRIEAPFIKLTKKEVILLAQKLQVDLENTLSCYQPIEAKACGKCLSCTLIEKALQEIKLSS